MIAVALGRLLTIYQLENGSLSRWPAHFSFLLTSVPERFSCGVDGLNCSLEAEKFVQNGREISTCSLVVQVLSRLKAFTGE